MSKNAKTKFIIIDPVRKATRVTEKRELGEALIEAGLKVSGVDHGSIGPHLGVVVYEFGLFVPPDDQHYFSINGRLYAGAGVLYGVDDNGETVDAVMPKIRFFDNTREVEMAIELEEVTQPSIAVNGQVLWLWPQPAPPGFPTAQK